MSTDFLPFALPLIEFCDDGFALGAGCDKHKEERQSGDRTLHLYRYHGGNPLHGGRTRCLSAIYPKMTDANVNRVFASLKSLLIAGEK